MRFVARRHMSMISLPLVMVALHTAPLAAQLSDDERPDSRSASEILAAAAEEAQRANDLRPAAPPSLPQEGAPSARAVSPSDSGGEPVDADAAPPPPNDVDPSAAPVEADGASDENSAPVGASGFDGIVPDRTTPEQLHAKWGRPSQVDRIPGGVRESFPSEAYDEVRVTIIEGVVDSLTLKLKQPLPLETMAKQMHAQDVEPVDVFDDQGRLLGQAYPERGMLFAYDPRVDQPRVGQVVIEPISVAPFLARAETRMSSRYADCLADLKQVLRLAPENGRAFWLTAEVRLRSGELEQAIQSAHRAIELEPEALAYRLTLAEAFSTAGDHRQAIEQVREVLDTAGASQLTLAQAYCQLGDCVAAAPERDYKQAIDAHMQAAKLGQPYAKSEIAATRRQAKQVLLHAYLGAAKDIGLGNWQQKATVVPKWLEQSLEIADDLIQHEHGVAETRLTVYEGALAALAAIGEPPDATRWIDGTIELGGLLVRQAEDPTLKARLSWRLAVALSDATEIETAHENLERALQLGNTAMAYFAAGETVGKRLPAHDYLRGWLSYRMGAIHAIHRADHRQAVAWYRHAVPLLESPAPPSAVVNTARHGETFVSMAVSYWEIGERDEALRLTEQGLKLMETAAADGQLERAALAVPYGNLARMYEQSGDARAAGEYAALAARACALGTQ